MKNTMKVCVITGGNSGIGYAAAMQIAKKGYAVIMICRRKEAAQEACRKITEESGNPNVSYLLADLSDMGMVRAAAKQLLNTHEEIDVLINNAADFDLSVRKPVITRDGMEKQFAANVAAPFLLCILLMPALRRRRGKIINISSQGLCVYPFMRLDFDNLHAEKSYSPERTYYQNKLALLMLSLYMRQIQQDVSVQAIRVTNVKIDMRRYDHLHPVLKKMYAVKSRFSISPEKMAKVYTALATENQYHGFLYDEHMEEVRANRFAYDRHAQEKLWRLMYEQLFSNEQQI